LVATTRCRRAGEIVDHQEVRAIWAVMSARVSRIQDPHLFERLRIEGLLSAFRSLDEWRQLKVIRFANALAMERTREMAARHAKRGQNVRNLTGWISGGAR
jgi:hypothetical protein